MFLKPCQPSLRRIFGGVFSCYRTKILGQRLVRKFPDPGFFCFCNQAQFKRCLWSQMKTLNMQSHYCRYELYNTFVNCLAALAYVPVPLIWDHYEALLTEELPQVCKLMDGEMAVDEAESDKDALNEFLDFFERTFLGSQTDTGWSSPQFAMETWNQHHIMTSEIQVATTMTNWSDNLTSTLKQAAPDRSMTIWALISHLQDLEMKARPAREEALALSRKEPNPKQGSTAGPIEPKGTAEKRRYARFLELVALVNDRTKMQPIDYLKSIGSFSKIA